MINKLREKIPGEIWDKTELVSMLKKKISNSIPKSDHQINFLLEKALKTQTFHFRAQRPLKIGVALNPEEDFFSRFSLNSI